MNLVYKRVFAIVLILLVAGYVFLNLPSQNANNEKVYQIYALKFSDLPESERQKYISKSELFEYGGYITPKSYTDSFDTSFDENLSSNVDELKAKISDLMAKNKMLIKDNIDIGEKNLELISKIDDIRLKTQIKASDIVAKNDENLKALEERHTQNIKALTERINELQLQSLESVKNYEQKVALLENKNLSLKMTSDKNASEILKQKELELTKLITQNDNLKKELDTKNQDVNHSVSNISEAKKQIKELNSELELSKSEIDSLKVSHKKELNRIQSGFDMQRSVLEDELSKKTNSIIDLKTELENSKNNAQKADLELRGLNDEKQKLNIKIDELNSQILSLKEYGLKQDSNITLLKDEILKANKSLKELNDGLEIKNLKLKTLDDKNLDLNKTLNLRDKNIDTLNQSIKELSDELNASRVAIKNLEINATSMLKELNLKNTELNAQKKSAETDIRNYEILRAKIDELSALTQNPDVKKLQDEIVALKSELSKKSTDLVVSSDVSKRIIELEKDLELGLDRQDKLEDENINLKLILENQTKPEVPKKVVFVSQVECRDMSDNLKVSLNCKNRVSDFLSRYNSNYMYEVIPIIDTRGYLLPYEVSSKLNKDEISRLNSYVDFGVGRDRANVAARLIKDEFGEFSRIIFSHEVIKRDNSRGFVIKVYR